MDFNSGLATGMFIWLVVYATNSTMTTMIVVSLACFFLGSLVRSFASIVAGLFASLMCWTLISLLLGSLKPTYSIGGNFVLISTFCLTVIFGIAVCYLMRSRTFVDNALQFLPLTGLLTFLINGSRGWTSEIAFGALVRNGEDNAAWLLALSHSVVNGHIQLSAASGTAGGPGTGVIINVVGQLMRSIGHPALTSQADNGLVLLRAYVLMAILIAVLWSVVSAKMHVERDRITGMFLGLVAGVVSYSFVMGLAVSGHFSAVVAVFFLSCAVFFAVVLKGETAITKWTSRVLVTSALVSAGQSWFPLTAIPFLYIAFVAVGPVWAFASRDFTVQKLRKALYVLAGVLVAGYAAFTRLFSSFFQNVIDIDYVTKNLTIPGGYATVNSWIVLLSFCAVTWWAFDSLQKGSDSSIRALALALILPTIGLFTWSYFLAPYTPQYGAWKYLYIAVATAAPLAIIVTGQLVPPKLDASVTRLLPVVLVLGFGLFSPPLNNINWVHGVSTPGFIWVEPIVKEIRESPDRAVGCLNTTENDTGQNYGAYLCSRMAFGLGGFDEPKHRVWTAANICQISPTQARSTLDSEFQKNFTVILFDGTRTSSFAECQAPSGSDSNGWLSSIDWKIIRKLDPYGKVVEIPATKPEK